MTSPMMKAVSFAMLLVGSSVTAEGQDLPILHLEKEKEMVLDPESCGIVGCKFYLSPSVIGDDTGSKYVWLEIRLPRTLPGCGDIGEVDGGYEINGKYIFESKLVDFLSTANESYRSFAFKVARDELKNAYIRVRFGKGKTGQILAKIIHLDKLCDGGSAC